MEKSQNAEYNFQKIFVYICKKSHTAGACSYFCRSLENVAVLWTETCANDGARIIVLVLSKYETQEGKDVTDLKETRLQEFVEWFEMKKTRRGDVACFAIVHSGSSPIYVMFSIDYDEKMEVIKPVYLCENKAISASFPRGALWSFFWSWYVSVKVRHKWKMQISGLFHSLMSHLHIFQSLKYILFS